jgi:hypothetical protein
MYEPVTRRKACSFLGFAAALGFAAPATLLSVTEAETQTVGMDRRQDRRAGRRDRRDDRRDVRQDRRDTRRGKTPETTGAAQK